MTPGDEPDSPPPARRVQKGSLFATVAVHGGIIALLFSTTVTQPARSVPRTLSVFDISAAATEPTPKAPQPKTVTPIPPPVVLLPTPNETVVVLPEQANASASSGACDLTEPVRAALQGSEEVVASLYKIPRDKLSVANAIMIWQATWLADDDDLDTTAVATIRDVIAETVAAATPECRLQPQVGPRLLLLSGRSDTVVLAVGSGEWRWQDLLDTAPADLTGEGVLKGSPPQTILASMDRESIASK